LTKAGSSPVRYFLCKAEGENALSCKFEQPELKLTSRAPKIESMDYGFVIGFALAAGLFIAILLCFEVGRRNRIRHIKKYADTAQSGTGSVETAVFGLLGLLIAFTFSGAATRFDKRRELIIQEANAIGTAYLRTDLLPADTQPIVQESFRNYVDSRLKFYRNLQDRAAATEEFSRSLELQDQIWSQSLSASQSSGAHGDAAKLLLPALNTMIDITTTRTMAFQMHPPVIVFVMLFGLILLGSVLAGNRMAEAKPRSWLYIVTFAAVMSVSFYVILDLEYPRFGLIRVDPFDQALVEVRARMK
jgi:hypothetical protein